MSISDEEFDRALGEWADRVRAELDITGAPLEIDRVLGVAGVAAHAVLRPAAPITTYLAGYAAGIAAAGGADPQVAARDALDRARRLASAQAAAAEQAGAASDAASAAGSETASGSETATA